MSGDQLHNPLIIFPLILKSTWTRFIKHVCFLQKKVSTCSMKSDIYDRDKMPIKLAFPRLELLKAIQWFIYNSTNLTKLYHKDFVFTFWWNINKFHIQRVSSTRQSFIQNHRAEIIIRFVPTVIMQINSIIYFAYFIVRGKYSHTVESRYNENLGTMKITLFYQVSHYIRVIKQQNFIIKILYSHFDETLTSFISSE